MTVEPVWGFLYSHGVILRTQRLNTLPIIRIGAWCILFFGYSKKSHAQEFYTAIIETMQNGTVIDFARHFPTM